MRISELANLTLSPLDLPARTLNVEGKGDKQRLLDLEKRALQALSLHAPGV